MASNKYKRFLISSLVYSYRFFSGNKLVDNPDKSTGDVKDICVFSTTALGDFMFNTPAILAIKQQFPEANITLVASSKNKLLLEKGGWFSNVYYWNQRIDESIGLIKKLRKIKPSIVVLLHSKSPYDILCATLSGANLILKDSYSEEDDCLRKLVTAVSDFKEPRHLIQRKLALTEMLGCSSQNIEMKIPFDVEKRKSECRTVGFQLGASEKIRQWPVSYFIQLAKKILHDSDEVRINIIGCIKDKVLANEFLNGLTEKEKCQVEDFTGKHSLPELVETISGFDFLITGDTGPLHIAIALKIRTISLFVTAIPEHTGPLQEPNLHTVIKGCPVKAKALTIHCDQPMAIISPDEVMNEVQKIASWR